MYGLAAWCPDLIVKGARGFRGGGGRSYVPRARPHVHVPHVGGHGSSSSTPMSDAEVVFLCIVVGALILIALLYAIERRRSVTDGPTDMEQLRRARALIDKRRG
jgi:hypothetical protein